ncbi:MAG: bifunctional acetate--CoA ligase family protein/GNAT family N-acetyltransferase [Rhodospirillales bacterium]|nr:bifunctional acetate--CoA ligase family protein/GNAT family N-acetyltransferase [Rhodospirillales bacterium]
MSLRNISSLLAPKSIAVIGASNSPQRSGAVFMDSLLKGGFKGPVMPVNPKYEAVGGILAYPDVESLPRPAEMAILCTPPHLAADFVRRLGLQGTRIALVVSEVAGEERLRLMAAAKTTGVRILGPSTLGVLSPKNKLNASFAHVPALPGNLGFVSQSGALCTHVLDWAHPKGIGFSHFVSLGDSADIDFADMLDFMGTDPATRAILLYIEDIKERRAFMAAARAAARNKPVLAVKAGRRARKSEAEAGRSGAVAEHDDVWDAALRRAGILRVENLDELFGAVETLARARPMKGEKLAIVSNGGGAGVMAEDALMESGMRPAELSQAITAKLRAVAPKSWNGANPVDIQVDAPPARYAEVVRILAEDRDIDAVLVIHSPNALASGDEIARQIIQTVKKHGGNILTSWVGGEAALPSRQIFAQGGLPTYETPRQAVRAFLHMVTHRKNREILMQTPPEAPTVFRPDRALAKEVIATALARGDGILTEPESKAVLKAYGIQASDVRIAKTPQEAGEISKLLGYPTALTVVSQDIIRKWDVGGVALSLETPEAVAAAAKGMIQRVQARKPGARIDGFTVQRMVSRQNARQLIIAVATDPLFGPVILFGEGGRAVEVIRDHAVALPPLNVTLAQELIERTRMSHLLDAYFDRPAADRDAIALSLMQVSQMLIDHPEIVELDINPLFADDKGVTAVDAHIRAAPYHGRAGFHLAIHPYPQSLEEEATLRDGRKIQLRPIKPEDEPAHYRLIDHMSAEDLRMRFFSVLQNLPHSEMARLTQIDYDREMAFIASLFDEQGEPQTLGVVRTVTDADETEAEFAIAIRSDMKGQGLGRRLMEKIIAYHRREKPVRRIHGTILAENKPMQELAKRLGFVIKDGPEPDVVLAELYLS